MVLRKRLPILVAALALLVLPSCRKQVSIPPNVVARVGERHIPLDEFKRYLERSAGMELAQISPKAASPLLDQFLEEVLLAEYAAANGMEVPAEKVADAVRNESGSTVVEKKDELRRTQLIALLTSRTSEPTSDEVQAYYTTHLDEFRSAEQVRVRQILVRDPKVAQLILEELAKGMPFEALSQKHSNAPNAQRGGEIGYVARGQLPKVFEDEIFRLKQGEVSGVIETNSSYHIFKVEERQPAGQVPLESVQEGIRAKLRAEALTRLIAETVSTAKQQIKVRVLTKRLPFAYSGSFAKTNE